MWGNSFWSFVRFSVYCYLFGECFHFSCMCSINPSLYALSTFLILFHLLYFIEQIIFPLTYCLTRRLKLLGSQKSQVNQKCLCQKLLRSISSLLVLIIRINLSYFPFYVRAFIILHGFGIMSSTIYATICIAVNILFFICFF